MPNDPVRTARFWSLVDQRGGVDACWPWRGCREKARPGYMGYGRSRWGRGIVFHAHRAAWLLANGKSSTDGLFILHGCDNPVCCNPAHLRPGTQAENIADRDARGRTCRGIAKRNAKLTENDIIDIRSLRSFGATTDDLAAAFGVVRGAVNNVLSRLTWGHVP